MQRERAGEGSQKPTYEFAYLCAACGRTYFSCAPDLVEQGTRCPRCTGVLRRSPGYDRSSPGT